MAAKRRTPVRRKTTGRTRTSSRKPVLGRRGPQSGFIFNTLVPFAIVLAIVFCIGALAFMGLRTVAASSFFEMRSIEVRGTNRASKEEIERIVRTKTSRNLLVNADLESARVEIEKMPYVKSAVVSRVLPDIVRINVEERIPRAAVRTAAGDHWYDEEGKRVSPVNKSDGKPPILMRGWDENDSDKARKDNQQRVKLYQKIQDEWQSMGIASRVTSLNLFDLDDPEAVVEDSGQAVVVALGKEDHGKRLQQALNVIAGKGAQIESLMWNGTNVIAKYRNS